MPAYVSNMFRGVSGKAGHGQDTDSNSDADTNSDPMRIESITLV